MSVGARRCLIPIFGISLVVSFYAAAVVAGLVILEWISRRCERVGAGRINPLVAVCLMGYAGWMIFTTLVSDAGGIGWAVGAATATSLVFTIGIGWSPDDLNRLAGWFAGAAAVSGLLSLLQLASGITTLPNDPTPQAPAFFAGWPPEAIRLLAARDGRSLGFRVHPIPHAETLLPAFLIGAAVLLRDNTSRWGRWMWGSALGLIGAGLVTAAGRGVWLGVGAGTFLFVLLGRRRRDIVFGFIVAITAAFLFFGFRPSLGARFMSSFSMNHGTIQDQASKSTHVKLWTATKAAIRERPVLGWGVRGLRVNVVDPATGQQRGWESAHNSYLQTAADGGMPLLILLLGAFAGVAVSIWKSSSAERPALAGIFLAFLIAGLSESWIKDKPIALIFWAFAGAAEGWRRTNSKEAS